MDKVLHNARIIAKKVLDIKKGESVLIITNPREDLLRISKALCQVAYESGAVGADLSSVPKEKIVNKYLIVQPKKTPVDNMEDYVREAISKKADIIISIPEKGLGKDVAGLKTPYKKGKISRDHIYTFLRETKQSRGFWTPHITLDTWERTIDIDYELLRERVKKLTKIMSGADKVHITTEKGTNLTLSLKNRKVLPDDGDITKKGGSGNMPCGEVFVGPKVGTMNGTWILDGMIPLHTGEILFVKDNPLTIKWENGYVKSISGKDAKTLENSLKWGETEALKKMKGAKAKLYSKSARHCGELGIGLNPNAKLVGTVLEDEKIMKTFHLAIGMNYEQDAPALIHLDGVTFNPTIDVTKKGKVIRILENGKLMV